jgi:hypothetical protein
MADETVTITFRITDMERFKASYKEALETSGYDDAEKREKLDKMDPTSAAVEIMAADGFDWENFGMGY